MPPVIAALASDYPTARRIVEGWQPVPPAEGPARQDKAAARVLAATVGYRTEIDRLKAVVQGLETELQTMTQERDVYQSAAQAATAHSGSGGASPLRRHAPARRTGAVERDYRTAAEVWLSGEVLVRPKRAAFKKSRGPQSVAVLFADGIEMRVSTYLEGQTGLNQAAQFARSVRQGEPLSNVDRLRMRAAGEQKPTARWVRDMGGTWRKVEIRDCPDVLTVEYAKD